MARIYISSTFGDLKDCREAVYRALRAMGHDVVAMEDYVAADERPLDKCLADVASCEIYVGIFAWRYGYVPVKDNPDQKSITELEFRHAVANNIPRLIFLLDENAPWPRSQMEQGEGAEKLRLLRDELSTDYTISFFRDCEQLARLVGTAVTNKVMQRPTGGSAKPTPTTPDKISIGRLPVTGRDLFGRDDQLAQLDAAWDDDATHVLSLVAWGGVGKSALVNHWLAQMARDNYRGASHVYGWSFYSQGTTDRAASADQFIEAALTWFGDPDPNKGSPWDKGERLARLVGAQRSLLLLDGLEPLQHPPGPDEGRLKDQALQSLLRSLAASNRGLCVITTRVPVRDVAPFEGNTHTRIDLETLSPEAGAQVLRAPGATGDEHELRRASEEFGGHSLALALLGSYLRDVYGGDIQRRSEIKDYEGELIYGGHAQKVMDSYEKWFGEGPELSVLRLLGLFNRPADKGSIDALRTAPIIPSLTEPLQGLSEPDWQRTLSKLRRARLLSERSANEPDTLDTHPLLREHFGQQLKRTHPDAWREANSRLYEHLRDTTKRLPDTLEEMAPLYAAIAHGCAAGRHQEAFDEVFSQRICRGNQYFSFRNLGAYSADLTALSVFFDTPWQQPTSRLTEETKSLLLAVTGYVLGALGRLTESIQPSLASLEPAVLLGDWGNAAITANSLSETYLYIGDIPQALNYAQQSVEFADKSGDRMQRMSRRFALGATYHAQGHFSKAESVFSEAEKILTDASAKSAVVPSYSGFKYCNLLLDEGRYQEARSRAERSLTLATKHGWHRDIALNYLSIGRACLLLTYNDASSDFAEATDYLTRSVNGLRQAGTLDELPRGLLARAELSRLKGEFNWAQGDLDEAMNIAARGEMGLYQADCLLEYARLYLARGENEKARESWAKAREMIERMGYHRRDKDVREIDEQLKAAGA